MLGARPHSSSSYHAFKQVSCKFKLFLNSMSCMGIWGIFMHMDMACILGRHASCAIKLRESPNHRVPLGELLSRDKYPKIIMCRGPGRERDKGDNNPLSCGRWPGTVITGPPQNTANPYSLISKPPRCVYS
jgi:hypothetical protein